MAVKALLSALIWTLMMVALVISGFVAKFYVVAGVVAFLTIVQVILEIIISIKINGAHLTHYELSKLKKLSLIFLVTMNLMGFLYFWILVKNV